MRESFHGIMLVAGVSVTAGVHRCVAAEFPAGGRRGCEAAAAVGVVRGDGTPAAEIPGHRAAAAALCAAAAKSVAAVRRPVPGTRGVGAVPCCSF